jgi:hypothetical protein
MLTLRQIERLWNASDFARLARELLAGRTELTARGLLDCAHRTPCAALALIRIDEFSQNHHPLAARLVRQLLASQDPDGGWGDAATTAIVLRALSTAKGHGLSIDRGVIFLTHLQKDDGLWPRIPIRRTDGDPLTTATVLHHLAHVPAARGKVDTARAAEVVADALPRLPARLPPVTHRHTPATESADTRRLSRTLPDPQGYALRPDRRPTPVTGPFTGPHTDKHTGPLGGPHGGRHGGRHGGPRQAPAAPPPLPVRNPVHTHLTVA